MIKSDEYNNILTSLKESINARKTIAGETPDVECTTVTKGEIVDVVTAFEENRDMIECQTRLCYTDVPLHDTDYPEKGSVIYKKYKDAVAQIKDDFVDNIACSDCFGTCSSGCKGSCSGSCGGGCQGSCVSHYCQAGCEAAAAAAVAACWACSPLPGILLVLSATAAGICAGCGFTCGSNCQGGCGGSCNSSCSGACSKGCKTDCRTNCNNSCSEGCNNSARIGTFPYQDAGVSQ